MNTSIRKFMGVWAVGAMCIVALTSCERTTGAPAPGAVEQVDLGEVSIWVESAFIRGLSDKSKISARFDSTHPDAWLEIPIEHLPSLKRFRVSNESDKFVSLIVSPSSANAFPDSPTPQSAQAKDVLELLARQDGSMSRPDLSSERGEDVRTVHADSLEYVVYSRQTGQHFFLASCTEILGRDGTGPDMCHRQFDSQGVHVSLEVSERLAAYADYIEQDLKCFISVWRESSPPGPLDSRYARCTTG